jgi:hypothetical protein
MKSRSARPARPAATSVRRPELAWIHDGLRYRVTATPDVKFECEAAPGEWTEVTGMDDVFASTALAVNAAQWRQFVEFLPRATRTFLAHFQFGRVAALHVITCCPGLLDDLAATPALTPFLAAHLMLRGGEQPAWAEINAVYERDGLFGVMQWLGLPASRQTIAILQNITDADVPRRFLEPLRAALWDPEAIWLLSHAPALTDERLAETCHALAA